MRGETYGPLPGGMIQPASLSPLAHRRDLSLWRVIMREYNEELLGAPEATGDTGTEVDYGRPRTACSTRRWTTVRCGWGASAWHWNHCTSPCAC
ncbi:hypothetical protein [Streptomyces pristinaespiralis]|uniref:hypothetical protein n=1 Tax=Streptomyces pristinaespiralis TaxID=38300 RepID=UPI0033C7F74E